MMITNTVSSKMSVKLGFLLFGAIASITCVTSIFTPFLPSLSVHASENLSISVKQKQAQPRVVKIAGTYRIVIDPKVLLEAKEEGVASVSGQWIINPNGYFTVELKAVSINGEVEVIRTTGTIRIINGKVVSQVETRNGKKLDEVPPTQSYTLLSDGKTLQADDQPVKLVRQ